MVKDILRSTDPLLRLVSKPVKKIDKKVLSIIADLKETLLVQKDPEGVGLAASQIGKGLRIFVVKEGDKPKIFINPEITTQVDEKRKRSVNKIMEGCLSLPNFYGPLKRTFKIRVKYTRENGEELEEEYEGLSSQIIQHEIDHLNGILFVDRLLQQKKPLYELVKGEWHEVELT